MIFRLIGPIWDGMLLRPRRTRRNEDRCFPKWPVLIAVEVQDSPRVAARPTLRTGSRQWTSMKLTRHRLDHHGTKWTC